MKHPTFIYKDPQKFWKEIEKLIESNDNNVKYLEHNGNKIHEGQEKRGYLRKYEVRSL